MEEKNTEALASNQLEISSSSFSTKKKIIIGVTCVFFILILGLGLFFLSKRPAQNQAGDKNTLVVAPYITTVLADQAKVYFTKLAKSSLQPSVIPSQFVVQSTKDENGSVTNPNRYIATWTTKNNAVGNSAVLFKDVDIIDVGTVIFNPSSPITSLSVITAPTLAATYFSVQPAGAWQCASVVIDLQANTQKTLCENFWTDQKKVKHGIGILANTQPAIFYCEIYPTSTIYDWKSCSAYKSQEGWN